MQRWHRATLLAVLLLAGAAGLLYLTRGGSRRLVEPDMDAGKTSEIVRANANLRPVDGSRVGGTVSFVALEDRRGLRVSYSFRRVPAGVHALHIHESGDCAEPDRFSGGGHFNPDGSAHGLPGSPVSHAGDLGNLSANETGWIQGKLIAAWLSLDDGSNAVLNRTVVLTLRADDGATQPDGNSGRPLACGIVLPG